MELLAKKRYLYSPGILLQKNIMQDCILFNVIYIVLKWITSLCKTWQDMKKHFAHKFNSH